LAFVKRAAASSLGSGALVPGRALRFLPVLAPRFFCAARRARHPDFAAADSLSPKVNIRAARKYALRALECRKRHPK